MTGYRQLPKAPVKPQAPAEPPIKADRCSRCDHHPPFVALFTHPQGALREPLCVSCFLDLGGHPNSDFTDSLRSLALGVRGPRGEAADDAPTLVQAFIDEARARMGSPYQLSLSRHDEGIVFTEGEIGPDAAGNRLWSGLLALAPPQQVEPAKMAKAPKNKMAAAGSNKEAV